MLNRTNRTLSANLNRLNLGTRSLVLVTSGINGNSTLRLRHAHGFAMRDGMFLEFDPSIRISSRRAIPVVPYSSPVSPWPGVDQRLGLWVRPQLVDPAVAFQVQTEAPDLKPKSCAKPVEPGCRAETSRAARPAAARLAAAGG
jgi:hypothetical protein